MESPQIQLSSPLQRARRNQVASGDDHENIDTYVHASDTFRSSYIGNLPIGRDSIQILNEPHPHASIRVEEQIDEENPSVPEAPAQ